MKLGSIPCVALSAAVESCEFTGDRHRDQIERHATQAESRGSSVGILIQTKQLCWGGLKP